MRAITYRIALDSADSTPHSSGSSTRLNFAEYSQRVHAAAIDLFGIDAQQVVGLHRIGHDYLDAYAESIAGGTNAHSTAFTTQYLDKRSSQNERERRALLRRRSSARFAPGFASKARGYGKSGAAGRGASGVRGVTARAGVKRVIDGAVHAHVLVWQMVSVEVRARRPGPQAVCCSPCSPCS